MIAQEDEKNAAERRQASLSLHRRLAEAHPLETNVVCPTLALQDGVVPSFVTSDGSSHSQWESQHIEWIIPAQKYAHQVMQKASEADKIQMAAAWADLNRVGRASAAPEVKVPKAKPREKQQQKCAFIGFCVCGNWQLTALVTRLQQFMRRMCPAKSQQQDVARRAMLVLRLTSLEDGDRWYHISYVNLKTWVVAAIPLVSARDEFRRLASGSCGRIALDVAAPELSSFGVNHWWGHLRNINFNICYRAQVYTLRDDELPIRDGFLL